MPCRDRGWKRAMRGGAGSPAGARGAFLCGRGRRHQVESLGRLRARDGNLSALKGGTWIGFPGARARDVFVSAGERDLVYIDIACSSAPPRSFRNRPYP